MARRPETTSEGTFHRENLEKAELFFDGALREWSPNLGLFAGSYWWNVRTYDAELRLAYSGISSFTVAPALRLLGVRITTSSLARTLFVTIRWVTNLPQLRLEARLLRGRRLVDRAVVQEETFIAGEPDADSFEWEPPRSMRAGTRVRLIVGVSGSGKKATLTRLVRAP